MRNAMSTKIMTMGQAPRIILTLVALFTIVGPFAADWNESHIFNPNWPPHAIFHSAMTLSLGVALGLSGLFFTWRKGGDADSNMIAANLFLSMYWITQTAAFFFPNTAWTDPELLAPGQTMDQLPPQVFVIALGLVPIAVADFLYLRRKGSFGSEGR